MSMKSERNAIAGKLMRLIPAGVLGWALIGCDTPPDFQPIAPPGAAVPRKSPDEEPAAAVGEMPASAPANISTSEKPPALPTAKNETKTTSGGVTYETLKEGTGAELKAGQTGQFLYEGRLDNGTIFDSTKERNNQPYSTNLSNVIDGWREGLPGMKVGEVRKLVIPPSLGYKAQGFPPKIPSNATLIFEVELVGITAQ
jgi:FKBP-type peptidyl-prolyl cis-trans isomerase FkpA